jgi:hypothetical protein
METHFVNSTYANAIVQRPFPNGDDVALDLIIECINDQLETVGGEIKKVIVLMDREGRHISASEMANLIAAGVSHKNPGRAFYIGVSDREIENWILADEQAVAVQCGNPGYGYDCEGRNGKSVLQKLTDGVDLGYRDKALLLKASYASRIRAKSPSFDNFVGSLDFEWWWSAR